MSLKEKGLDPRVKRTRQLLIQSFMELMMEKDFQSITVQDIAGRATINRATFYAHFNDKYALLDQIIRDSFQDMLQDKLSPSSEFSLDNLRSLVLAVCQYLQQFQEHLGDSSDSQFEPLIEKEIQSQIAQVILRWIPQLQGKKPISLIDSEVIASALGGTILGAGLHWSRGNREKPVEEISNQILSLILGGLNGIYQLDMFYHEENER